MGAKYAKRSPNLQLFIEILEPAAFSYIMAGNIYGIWPTITLKKEKKTFFVKTFVALFFYSIFYREALSVPIVYL